MLRKVRVEEMVQQEQNQPFNIFAYFYLGT